MDNQFKTMGKVFKKLSSKFLNLLLKIKHYNYGNIKKSNIIMKIQVYKEIHAQKYSELCREITDCSPRRNIRSKTLAFSFFIDLRES